MGGRNDKDLGEGGRQDGRKQLELSDVRARVVLQRELSVLVLPSETVTYIFLDRANLARTSKSRTRWSGHRSRISQKM